MKENMPKVSNSNIHSIDASSDYMKQLFTEVKRLHLLKGDDETYIQDYLLFIDIYTAGFLDGKQSMCIPAKTEKPND